MQKFLSNTQLFYPSVLLAELIIFFAAKAISPVQFDYSFLLSTGVLILILLLLEKLVFHIFKVPYSETRVILLMFLFFSPIIQLNLFLSFNKFMSAFFLLFAFLNYSQFVKELKKKYLLFSFFSIIFSIYFYSYTLAAVLPLLIFIIIKSGWKGIIYFIGCIVFFYFFFNAEILNVEQLNQWKPDNLFKSEFDLISYYVANFIFAFFPLFHPLIFIPGIIVLPFIRVEDFEEPVIKISAVSFVISAFFISGFPFQQFSMLIITFPLLLIILFPSVRRVIHLTEYFRPHYIRFLPFIVLIIQMSLFIFLLISNEQMYFK